MKLQDCKAFSDLVARVEALESGSGGGGGLVIYPACGNARANFFNEQRFAWGFSVQAGGGDVVDPWQYVVSGANYQLDVNAITNNSAFTYEEVANADGTYDHIFTGVSPLQLNTSTPTFEWTGVDFGFNPRSESQRVNCP